MSWQFGSFIREQREKRLREDPGYTLRKVAARIGVSAVFLSKIERGDQTSLSEEKVLALARELDQDPDVMLAMSGKVSSDIQAIIRKRPELFARLIREIRDMPDHAVLRLVREVRDGDW